MTLVLLSQGIEVNGNVHFVWKISSDKRVVPSPLIVCSLLREAGEMQSNVISPMRYGLRDEFLIL